MANIPLKTIKFPGLANTYTIPGVSTDLTASGKAADAAETGRQIGLIKADLEDLDERVEALEEGGSGGSGLTDAVKTALLQLAQKVAYIDEHGQDYYDDLYDALYAITAITLNTNSISMQTIGATSQLTATTTPAGGSVTWSSSNTSVATVSSTGLVTSVAYGSATITATAGSVSATCSVVVAQATCTGITASYTQSGTVYDNASLDDLKSDLVVTASWSNGTTSTLNDADYTLSGTLAEGTSTITVAYGGKTALFNVTVTRDLSVTWDYTMGLPDENGFTLAQSESGSPSATIEADGVQMVVSGPTENYIRYEYNTPTPNGTFEFQFKSGSANNLKIIAHLATDSSGNGISVRMQYSNGYKGIYLIDSSEGISSYTLLKAMALNTVYTVKFVVNNGLVDVYVDDEKLAEGVPVNSISQNTATYFHLGSSSSTTASVNCKLMSMSIRV